jgi:hypothetical protein
MPESLYGGAEYLKSICTEISDVTSKMHKLLKNAHMIHLENTDYPVLRDRYLYLSFLIRSEQEKY